MVSGCRDGRRDGVEEGVVAGAGAPSLRARARERESAGARARVRSPGSLRKPTKYDCFLLNSKTGPYTSLYNPLNKIIGLDP